MKRGIRLLKKEAKVLNENDYNHYSMSAIEFAGYSLFASVAVCIVSYIFYRSAAMCILLSPLGLLYPHMKRKMLIKRRKKELNTQFKDMLYALSSSLSAGRPIESAFMQVPSELSLLYPDSDTAIVREARIIQLRLELNETLESALDDLARRSHVEDIKSFAEVFRISRKSGANMVDVIRNTTNIINDRIEIRQEIETMLAERNFEQKVLYILPPAMVVLLSFTASDYILPVFTTAAGRIVMTVALMLFALAYVVSKKINEIEL